MNDVEAEGTAGVVRCAIFNGDTSRSCGLFFPGRRPSTTEGHIRHIDQYYSPGRIDQRICNENKVLNTGRGRIVVPYIYVQSREEIKRGNPQTIFILHTASGGPSSKNLAR